MFIRLNASLTESKCKAGLLLLLILLPMTLGLGSAVDQSFWYGINELLINSDTPDGIRHGIGLFGICHAAMETAIWGFCVGGGAGAVAGITAGL